MKRLIFLRHAKSSWNEPGLPDRERPLNKRGEHAARLMGTYMRERGLVPDVILCSPATRTRETVDGVLAQWDRTPQVTYDDRLYLTGPADILAVIAGADDTAASVLVVGHNPGLQQTVLRLIGKDPIGAKPAIAAKLPTGALAVFDIDIDHWRDLRPGALVDFQRPKTLT